MTNRDPEKEEPLLEINGHPGDRARSMRSMGAAASCQPTATFERLVLMGIFVASVLIAAANQVLFKKLLTSFSADGSDASFAFFANNWTVLLYLVLAMIVLGYKLLFTRDITRAMRDASRVSVFCVMGLLDAAAGLAGAIGGTATPGSIQTLLNQVTIVFTVILGLLYLRERYHRMQYLGSALIFAGACVATIPSFLGGGDEGRVAVVPVLVFIAGLVPSAFSNVYKEKHMKEDDQDVFYLSGWVTSFQCLFGILSIPLLAVPGLGGVPFRELPSQVSGGMKCFVGDDPTPDYTRCDTAPLNTMLYVVVNFAYNAVLLVLTKRGSALLLVLSGALALPVTNIAFSLRIVMGDDREPFSVYSIAGLVVVIIGFLVYSRLGLAEREENHFVSPQGPPGQMIFTTWDTRPRRASYSDVISADRPRVSAPIAISSTPGASAEPGEGRGKTRRASAYANLRGDGTMPGTL